MWWDKLKKFLPFIGIVIFIYILLKLDIGEILIKIYQAVIFHPGYILLGILFQIFSLIILTIKWYFLALKQKIQIPFKEAFKINLITHFYGFITPSRIGSLTRAGYLEKYSHSFGKGASNFVLDKVLEVTSLFLTVVIFGFLFRDYLGISFLIYIFLLFLLSSFLIIIFINKERAKIILRFFYHRLIPEKMKKKARFGFDSFYEDMPSKGTIFYSFLLNIFSWILIYFVTFIFGLSVEINLSFIYFLAILPMGTIIAQLPISMAGLGTREATLIVLFGLKNISASDVFSMSLLSLLFGGIIPSIIGAILAFKKQ